MDLMALLSCIIDELACAGVSIVLKGAMLLNLIIHENNATYVWEVGRQRKN